MKSRSQNINVGQLLLILTLFISLFSYEAHIYQSYYSVLLVIVLALGILAVCVSEHKSVFLNSFRVDSLPLLLLAAQLVSGILSTAIYGISANTWPIVAMTTYLTIFVFYSNVSIIKSLNLQECINIIMGFITACAAFSVLLYEFGTLLGYKILWGSRSPSIFFDANYAGAIFTVSSIYYISEYSRDNRKLLVYAVVNTLGVLTTGSRGALVSLVIGIVSIFFLKESKVGIFKKIIIIAILLICIYIGYRILLDFGYLRVSQGSSGRIEMWQYIIKIISDNPVTGFGYGSTNEILASGRFTNGSSHNAYLDYISMYGIPVFIIYATIIIKSILKEIFSMNCKASIVCCSICLLANAMTISINFGGLGILSLLLTLFLGLMNCNDNSELYPL